MSESIFKSQKLNYINFQNFGDINFQDLREISFYAPYGILYKNRHYDVTHTFLETKITSTGIKEININENGKNLPEEFIEELKHEILQYYQNYGNKYTDYLWNLLKQWKSEELRNRTFGHFSKASALGETIRKPHNIGDMELEYYLIMLKENYKVGNIYNHFCEKEKDYEYISNNFDEIYNAGPNPFYFRLKKNSTGLGVIYSGYGAISKFVTPMGYFQIGNGCLVVRQFIKYMKNYYKLKVLRESKSDIILGKTEEICEIVELNGKILPSIEYETDHNYINDPYGEVSIKWNEMRKYLYWRLNNDNDYQINVSY